MFEPQNYTPVGKSSNRPWSAGVFRPVGYGLLVLAFLNFADILIPPHFMDPVWELQSVGALIESVPIPILGLIFVFYGEFDLRGRLEQVTVKLLSWTCLLCALLFLLLIPVVASNTIRLDQQVTTQTSDQLSQQMGQINQVEDQLSRASSEELNQFLRSQGISLDRGSSQDVKDHLLSRLNETRKQVQIQSTASRISKHRSLLKNAVKWIIGALVSGFIFIYLWRQTHWARSKMPKQTFM